MGTFTRWRGNAGGGTHHTTYRPFWVLWLIGILKFLSLPAGIFAALAGGAWIFRAYPHIGDVVAIAMIVALIALGGLICSPRR